MRVVSARVGGFPTGCADAEHTAVAKGPEVSHWASPRQAAISSDVRCFGTAVLIAVGLLNSPAVAQMSLPATDGLLSDVRRIVAASEDSGWFIDAEEYELIESVLLESACRTPDAARQQALSRLERRNSADPRALYVEDGNKSTARVRDALTRQRRYIALRRTLERLDECPFYIETDPDFRGRQTEREKWAVHLEGGGVGEATRSDGQYTIGGGGSGRLLLGRGIGDRYSMLVGGEVGGGAELNRPSVGEAFKVKYSAAAPVVFRIHRLSWFYDVEVGPVANLKAADLDLSWGSRVGFGFGLTTLRTLEWLPWVGVAAAADGYWPQDGEPSVLILRAGIRVGIRWLP